MLDELYASIGERSTVAPVILSVALMLFFGFAMTRLTKRLRLPNVTAYIAAGILLGPYALDLVPTEVVSGMAFLSDIALAFIAFGVGEFFKVSALKRNGWRTVVITLTEALLSALLVFFASYLLLGLSLSFSLVLAALASATAPASTVMTIRQTGARGDFVDTLLQVMALDNVVSLLAYSVAISVAVVALGGGALSFGTVAMPLLRNLLGVLVGGVLGFALRLLIPEGRSNDNRLIIVVALLFLFCGFCSVIDVSPLLGCMMIGAVYVNLGGDPKLFLQVSYFSPPVLLLFFVRSGIGFRLDSLFAGSSLVAYPLVIVSVVYFLVRIVGKVGGCYLGCLATGKEKRIRKYLGFAEIPQASVAIGLAVLGARALGGESGVALETVIVAAGVLYEIVGPVSAKLALYLSGSYTDNLEELTPDAEGRDEVAILCERIRAIREDLPPPPAPPLGAEEEAFTEAALEQREVMGPRHRGPWRRF